ncbi:MAG: PQQ-binding-like beta-propeller repeat protein, partial [Armatimonadota bacterium]|nr:PQQ-binding-like beta-propeller repeat protein [Armatimonadota bacterium]
MRKGFGLGFLLVGWAACQAQGVWPMEKLDRWGTGKAPAGPPPGSYTSPWVKYRVTGPAVSHSPALGQGNVGFYGSWIPAHVGKFNISNGTTLGVFDTLGNFAQSTPAIASNGQIYAAVAANYQNSPVGRLFSINPVTMDYDWTFVTNAVKFSDYESVSPILGPDGDIMISSTTGQAWRIDDATGVPVWTKSGLGAGMHTIVFTRDDTKVIVPNGNSVTAFDYATGNQEWTLNCGAAAGAPAVSPDGTVIFGCDNGTIFALNPDTGGIEWTWLALASVRAAPAFSNGKAYVSGHDNRLYCFDVATGNRDWSFTATNQLRQAPSVDSNGRIYVLARFGELYCVSPSGSLIWSHIINAEGRGPLSIGADGTVYASGGGIFAITQTASSQSPESYSTVRGINIGGGLLEILQSDNLYLSYRPGIIFSSGQPPVELTFNVTCPRSQLASITISLESGATTSALVQKIFLWDNNSSLWVEVDSRASTVPDSVAEITVNTFTNRFVQAGTNLIKMRVTWK